HLIYERLQTDERIETEDLKISLKKGVLFLDGTLESEAEHELIVQVLTDSMGFSAIIDRIRINDLLIERDDFTGDSQGVEDLDSHLFYNRDALREDAYETGMSPFGYFENDSL